MRTRIATLLMPLLCFTSGAHAQPGIGVAAAGEDRSAFNTRCRREILAQSPGAAAQADAICGSKWDMITATGPMGDAVLLLAPPPGATFDPAGARGRLTTVLWSAKPGKDVVASGRLGELEVRVARTPVAGATFDWFKDGTPIPFDLPETLKVRGAKLAMVGCLDFGVGEGGRVYRVTAPGKAPFTLSISFREAAVASQSSSFTATADYGGQLPTLTALRRDGSEWSTACPQ